MHEKAKLFELVGIWVVKRELCLVNALSRIQEQSAIIINQWRLRQVNRFLDISFYITLHENYVTHEIFTFRAR